MVVVTPEPVPESSRNRFPELVPIGPKRKVELGPMDFLIFDRTQEEIRIGPHGFFVVLIGPKRKYELGPMVFCFLIGPKRK